MKRIIRTLSAALVLAALLVTVLLQMDYLAFVWVLVTGWGFYLSDVLPRLRWNLGSWVIAGLFLTSGGIGLHCVLVWWSRKRGNSKWSIRQTCLVLAMGLVACATALASAGIFHHSVWLISAREPIFRDISRSEQVSKLSMLKQVGLGLRLWQLDHEDRMPVLVGELYPEYVPAHEILVEGNLGYQLVTPWEYYGSGLRDFPADAILLASTQNGRGTRVVVFGDQSGRLISEDEYREHRARYPEFLAP